MTLIDTHVLVWLDAGSQRLGSKARLLLNKALKDENLAVSAVSFWEIAMLVEKGRLEISMDLAVWRKDLLHNGLHELPLSGSIGIRAGSLVDFHGDPADRMIVATALGSSTELFSADRKILKWAGSLKCRDARL